MTCQGTSRNSGTNIMSFICQMHCCPVKCWINKFVFSSAQHPCMLCQSSSYMPCMIISHMSCSISFKTHLKLPERKAREDGIVAFDCKENEEVLLLPYGLFLAGDNPMQATQCSHAGLCANLFCRICKTGGTKKHRATDGGYAEIFRVSQPWYFTACSVNVESPQ